MNTISMDEISNGHTIHPNPTNETERAKKGENVARFVGVSTNKNGKIMVETGVGWRVAHEF